MAACVENCRTKSTFLCWTTAAAAGDSSCKFSVCSPRRSCTTPIDQYSDGAAAGDDDEVWAELRDEARSDVEDEPILRQYYSDLILSHRCLESALAAHLAGKLCVPGVVASGTLYDLLFSALAGDPSARRAVRADLRAARDRDPACAKMVHCFLYYKGFLALQAHRAAHRLWGEGRRAAALLLQGRASEAFAVDIHPGAAVGEGVLLDHATGVVIGETAVVGSDVSILHGVTLGGTGKESGDRHPKIGDGVLIGAGTHILGNIRIGDGAKIGPGRWC
uniref:serine O-acetyltransferase n=1 Tax=Ananas comosus var. bracteatus TaxID=296719 RepID=A0A6V7Q464_ANACO|nr:unnamed protein product [Ananas comosus var. bracteatus]